ncbi:MAG TPA: hypothetical protein VMW43_03415 [Bacteroidota bacterium]|nr:hypothetical protein [Bacteroidota bacterium]
MEQVTLDLQPEPSTPRMRIVQRIIFILIGITNIVQGVINNNSFTYVNLIFGVGIIVFALFYRRIYKPKIFTFDDEGIEGPINADESVRLRWSDVRRIEARMFAIKLITRTRGEYRIYLGNLTFAQHKAVKPKILQIANAHGVDVRISER